MEYTDNQVIDNSIELQNEALKLQALNPCNNLSLKNTIDQDENLNNNFKNQQIQQVPYQNTNGVSAENPEIISKTYIDNSLNEKDQSNINLNLNSQVQNRNSDTQQSQDQLEGDEKLLINLPPNTGYLSDVAIFCRFQLELHNMMKEQTKVLLEHAKNNNTDNSVKPEHRGIKRPYEIRIGDWICPREQCKNINFGKRMTCNMCSEQRPDQISDITTVITPAVSKDPEAKTKKETGYLGGPIGLFKEGDWKCKFCGNINFEKRQKCNRCKKNKDDVAIEDSDAEKRRQMTAEVSQELNQKATQEDLEEGQVISVIQEGPVEKNLFETQFKDQKTLNEEQVVQAKIQVVKAPKPKNFYEDVYDQEQQEGLIEEEDNESLSSQSKNQQNRNNFSFSNQNGPIQNRRVQNKKFGMQVNLGNQRNRGNFNNNNNRYEDDQEMQGNMMQRNNQQNNRNISRQPNRNFNKNGNNNFQNQQFQNQRQNQNQGNRMQNRPNNNQNGMFNNQNQRQNFQQRGNRGNSNNNMRGGNQQNVNLQQSLWKNDRSQDEFDEQDTQENDSSMYQKKQNVLKEIDCQNRPNSFGQNSLIKKPTPVNNERSRSRELEKGQILPDN